jgi:hypothetical protein
VVTSLMDRLGVTVYIQAFMIALVAVGVIGAIYARFNRN